MRIVSDGNFDPLCSSPMVVANAETMQPRPILYRQVIVDSLDNGKMRCEPCIRAGHNPANYVCVCGCFQVDLPQLYTGTGGFTEFGFDTGYTTICSQLKALTTPKTITLTSDTIPNTDRLILGYVPSGLVQCTQNINDIGCLWGAGDDHLSSSSAFGGSTYYEAYYLWSHMVPDRGGKIGAAFFIAFERPKVTGFGGLVYEIFAVYTCPDFSASGGLFTYSAASSSTMCGVIGGTAGGISGGCSGDPNNCNLPSELSIRGVPCPS